MEYSLLSAHLTTITGKIRGRFFLPVILILSLFISQKASASHAAGAEITYTWVGPGMGNYKITYSLYRDCAGINAPNSVSIQVRSVSCNIARNLTLTFDNTVPGNGGEIGYQCPGATRCSGGLGQGYQKYVYTGTIDLQFQCTDWVFSYGLSARNSAITDLNNPGSTDLYVDAKLDNVNAPHNSSTQFSNYPIVNVCTGQPFTYNSGALDANGDSVSYELVCAKEGANSCVSYSNGTSFTHPLQPNGSVVVNPVTGDVVINTSTVQIGVVAVVVKEWKLIGGVMVLVGTVVRDMQINVTNCSNQVPTQSGINGTTKRDTAICVNTSISFTINAGDPNSGQVVTMTWNNGIAGASFSVFNNSTASPVGTFAWTPTVPGVYQFTVSVADNFCPTNGYQTYSYTITVRPGASITAASPTICQGSCATLTASGVLTYFWNTGVSNAPITVCPTVTTVYTVSSTDASLCSGFKVVTVTVNPPPTINTSNKTVCSGSPLTLTASSPTAVTYNWTPCTNISPCSGPSIGFTGTAATTYTYTITASDAFGCTNTNTMSVTVNPIPVITTNNMNVCSGQLFTLTAGGASTYSWNTGATTTSISLVINSATTLTNTYTVWGTANGCTGFAIATVNVTPTPPVTVSPSQNVCLGTTLTLTVGGAGTYLWSYAGATTTAIAVTPTSSITYTVTGSQSGCPSASAVVSIGVIQPPTISVGNLTICLGSSKAFTASGTSTSYSWSPITWLGSVTGPSPLVTPFTTGTTTYTVTGTNAGCSTSTVVTATANSPAINANPVSICRGFNATLTASGASTYVWSPGGPGSSITVVLPTASTTYTVTGTDVAGCSSTKTVALTVNQSPNIGAGTTSVVCVGNSATLTAIGAGAGTYVWSPSGGLIGSSTGTPVTTISLVSIGITTYTVVGTDGNGCTNTTVLNVNVNAVPVVTASPGVAICNGFPTTLTAGGATNYAWSPCVRLSTCIGSPVVTTATTAITYTVTGSNASGCSSTATVPVTMGSTFTVSAPSPGTYCSGSPATLTASGAGTGGTYAWSGPQSYSGTGSPASPSPTPTATTFTTYTYTVLATNAFGCTGTATTTASYNPLPTVSSSPTTNPCSGSPVSLTALGANTYVWSPPTGLNQTTGNVVTHTSTNTTGASISYTYTITGTNTATGCSNTSVKTFLVKPITDFSLTATDICIGGSTTMTIQPIGTFTNTTFKYSWAPSTPPPNTTGVTLFGSSGVSFSTTITPTANTTYTVDCYQAASSATCPGAVHTVTVNVVTQPNVIVVPTNPSVCGGVGVALTASGATTYAWSPATALSATTGAVVTSTATTTMIYTVTGTLISGASSCTNTYTISVSPQILPTLTATAPPVCIGLSTTLSADGSGTTGPYTYSWTPPTYLPATTGPSHTVTPTVAGTTAYTVTVTDGNGCKKTQATSLVTNALPNITVNSGAACVGNSVTLTANGGTTYAWSPPTGLSSTTGSIVTSTTSTTYTVTGTGTCSNTATATVTINPLPTTTISTPLSTICLGSTTTLTAGGATTYAWNTGASTQIISVSPSVLTTYTVTGTSQPTGCTSMATISITPVDPVITVSAPPSAFCGTSSVTLTAGGMGVGGTYVWNPGGLFGSDQPVTPTTTTTYTVTGTDAFGCTDAGTVTVTVNPIPSVSVNGSASGVCQGIATILTASGTPATYLWSTTQTTTTISVSPTATTTYSVTASALGCTASASIIISAFPPPPVSATGATTCRGTNATLSASGANTYVWSPAGILISNTGSSVISTATTATTYTIIGTDVNGCTNTTTASVTVNGLPTITTSGQVAYCSGLSKVMCASGAGAGGSYLWTPPIGLDSTNGACVTHSLTNTTGAVVPYTYTITGTDANGCKSTAIDTATVRSGAAITTSPPVTICQGASTVLTVSGSGTNAYIWSWSTNTTCQAATCATLPLTPTVTTTYSVQLVGATCGNPTIHSVTVTVIPPINAGPAASGTVCNGAPVTLTASGGTTYAWSPATAPPTGASVSANPTVTTTYTVTTPGINGCPSSKTVTVTVPTFTASSANICQGDTATLCASGGVSYSWAGSNFVNNVNTGLCVGVFPPSSAVGSYTVHITDASGCVTLMPVNVNVTSPIITASGGTVCSGNPLTLTASGAGIGGTYAWNPATAPPTGASVTVLPTATTNYTVTGTTAAGCKGSTVLTVTVPIATASPASICAGSSTFLFADGGPGAAYSWVPNVPTTSILNPLTNNPTVNPTTTTTYSVYITDASGCTTILPATVNVYLPPTTPVIQNNLDTLHFTPTAGYTYQWYLDTNLLVGKTDTFLVGTVSGPYYVKVTDTTSHCSILILAPVVSSPLPIELLEFNALPSEDYVTLLWATASEINNDYFTVEKSKEGDRFIAFEKVNGTGNSSVRNEYYAFDRAPYRPITYYRLKQTDTDGKYSYSQIVAVEIGHAKDDVINLFPNPTTRRIEYDYFSSMDATAVIQLSDLTGRVLKSVSVRLIKGLNHLSSDLDGLASGIYHIQFSCEDTDFNLVKKVVKF